MISANMNNIKSARISAMAFAAVLTVSALTLIIGQEADARIRQDSTINQQSRSVQEGLINVNAGNVGANVQVGACVPANVQVIGSDSDQSARCD
jgi:hypothetical protein